MQFIVLDMEWNQPWPGSYSARRVLPTPIHGEIIQIGAVRLSQAQEVQDEFQILVRPKVYKKLNKKVSSLTGLKDAMLKENGVAFPDAVELFRRWCGEDCVFLTWGFDDVRILRENLALFSLDDSWTERWYNAQMIFNKQTDGSNAQKALKTAMELMGIEATRPAHDALGDAYHTALICAGLNLRRGIEEYGKSLEEHENGFHGAQIPDCLDRRVFRGFPDREAVLAAMAGKENLCPNCAEVMRSGPWLSQQGHRYMARMTCPKCGDFLVRIRLQHEEDGTVRVGRLVYSGDSEAAKNYAALLAARHSAQRRRRRRKPAEKKAES